MLQRTLGVLLLSVAIAVPAFGENPSSDDTKFMKEAANGGMLEVELGKIALTNASNSKVKDFGKRMRDDHTKANNDLKKLASSKGVELPTKVEGKEKLTLDRLSKLSGVEFDREYMKAMVDDHKEDISAFENASQKAKDPDVKKFASEHLPTLKTHLDLAQAAAGQVGAE
jgi:putative membrane protein